MKNESSNISAGFIVIIVIIVGLLIALVCASGSSNNHNNQTKTETVKKENSSKTVEPEKHTYTGYCQLEGGYRKRYVQCYGDYDPAAKRKAEAKAELCNNSSSAVSGCTMKYTY